MYIFIFNIYVLINLKKKIVNFIFIEKKIVKLIYMYIMGIIGYDVRIRFFSLFCVWFYNICVIFDCLVVVVFNFLSVLYLYNKLWLLF